MQVVAPPLRSRGSKAQLLARSAAGDAEQQDYEADGDLLMGGAIPISAPVQFGSCVCSCVRLYVRLAKAELTVLSNTCVGYSHFVRHVRTGCA